MSGPEDARFSRTPLQGDGAASLPDGLASSPRREEFSGAAPVQIGAGLEALPGDSDRTIELPLGIAAELAAEHAAFTSDGDVDRDMADLTIDGDGDGDGAATADMAFAASELYGETPTAPLPVDIEVDLDAGSSPFEDDVALADPFAPPPIDDFGPPSTNEPAAAETSDARLGADVTAPRHVDVTDELEDSLDEELDLVEASADGARTQGDVASRDGMSAHAERVVITPPPVPMKAVAVPAASARAPQPPASATPTAGGPSSPTHVPPLPPQELLQPTEAWAEPLSQRPRRKRLKPWFEEVFDEDYLRTLPFMTAEQTLREVSFIRDGLSPPPDGELLDVACGYGRHAIELSQRGLKVTGIDLSLPLLIRAADESQRRGLSVNFVHADMRELTFENQFDGAYCMLTSFGYFDEETNLKVAAGIHRALKPGGRLLLDTINRDYIVGELPTRVWWEGDGCLVLEEVDFNYHTSRLAVRRSVVFQDGRQLEHDISIRAYSLHELGKLMRHAGFRVTDVSGSIATRGHFFGATSRNLIMVCEKTA